MEGGGSRGSSNRASATQQYYYYYGSVATSVGSLRRCWYLHTYMYLAVYTPVDCAPLARRRLRHNAIAACSRLSISPYFSLIVIS